MHRHFAKSLIVFTFSKYLTLLKYSIIYGIIHICYISIAFLTFINYHIVYEISTTDRSNRQYSPHFYGF